MLEGNSWDYNKLSFVKKEATVSKNNLTDEYTFFFFFVTISEIKNNPLLYTDALKPKFYF